MLFSTSNNQIIQKIFFLQKQRFFFILNPFCLFKMIMLLSLRELLLFYCLFFVYEKIQKSLQGSFLMLTDYLRSRNIRKIQQLPYFFLVMHGNYSGLREALHVISFQKQIFSGILGVILNTSCLLTYSL